MPPRFLRRVTRRRLLRPWLLPAAYVAFNDNYETPIANAVAYTQNDSQMKGIYDVMMFGAVGDGVTDDTAAIRAAAQAVAASARDNPSSTDDGRLLATATLVFPPGSFLITEADALLAMATEPGRGYVIEGAGREATQVIFAPTSTAYLIANAAPGWQHLSVRDIGFVMENGNASFMKTDSANAQRDYTFERVNWLGTSNTNYGFRDVGRDSYDTLSFWHCGVFGTWATFFWVEGSDQAVCHSFYEQTFEVRAGNFIVLARGGNVNVWGGSLVVIGTGSLFECLNADHYYGTSRLLVSGVRVELRSTTAMLLYSEWSSGTILFSSVDAGSQTAFVNASTVNVIVHPLAGYGSMPSVRWQSCVLLGRHEYRFDARSFSSPSTVMYEGCEFTHHGDAHGFLALTDESGEAKTGGTPVVMLRQCRGALSKRILDTDQGWHLSARGETTRKVVSVKTGWGTNPFNGGYEDTVLPLGAVVVVASIFAPPEGWVVSGASTADWTLTFQTIEDPPTVLLVAAPGTTPSAGFSAGSALWHVCDTDARRTIRLVANAEIQDSNGRFIARLEYIG